MQGAPLPIDLLGLEAAGSLIVVVDEANYPDQVRVLSPDLVPLLTFARLAYAGPVYQSYFGSIGASARPYRTAGINARIRREQRDTPRAYALFSPAGTAVGAFSKRAKDEDPLWALDLEGAGTVCVVHVEEAPFVRFVGRAAGIDGTPYLHLKLQDGPAVFPATLDTGEKAGQVGVGRRTSNPRYRVMWEEGLYPPYLLALVVAAGFQLRHF